MPMHMDQALARRLERTEGAIGASYMGVRRRLAPELGATWHDFDGTYAIFDGAGAPFTQSFGLGLFAPVTLESLAAIEAFFEERGAVAMHEVSPLAGIETIALLATRGYQPIELSTVLVRELADRVEPPAADVRARVVTEADHAAWIEASVAGWSDDPEVVGMIRSIAEATIQNPSLVHFIVDHEGAAIATASMGLHEGVALLAGASTVPAGRGLGAHSVLQAARIDEARRRGGELAMMVAMPGSTSQRNAERRGFHVAYSRTKWRQTR